MRRRPVVQQLLQRAQAGNRGFGPDGLGQIARDHDKGAVAGAVAESCEFHVADMSVKLRSNGREETSVRRREFLRAGAATALATPTLAAPAIAQSAPEIKWRLTSSFSKTLETMYGTSQIVCRYIAEATDNKFLIQPYQAGELAPSRQALDAVSSGSVDCAHTPTNFYVAKDPTLGFGTGIPFGLSSRHQQSWWTFGGGAEIVNAALKRLNVVGIPAGLTGAQMGAWFKKEIASVDDLKGLRWRISRAGRAGAGAGRRGAAGDPPCRRLRGARAGHDRCRRVHLPARRREARPAEGGEVQLLSLLVGKRRHGASGRQSREMERAAQVLPGDRRPGLRCGEHVDARQVRCGQCAGAQAADRRRGRAEALPAARHGRVLQGHQRAPRRAGGQGRALQEGAQFRQRLPQGAAAAGCRSPSTPSTASRCPCAAGPDAPAACHPRAPPSS